MTEKETYALIERYLSGELTGPERLLFEQQRQNDPVFADRYRDYQELQDALQLYKTRTALKQRLNIIHEQVIEPEKPGMPAMEPEQSKWRVFWNQHFATMAVAASVAVITVFGSLVSVDAWRSVKKQQNARYSELRREVDQIKRSQRALMQDISGSPTYGAKPNLRPASFSGTGFMLSANGYFVTSYHVIKDADSVYIENQQGLRYKVKDVFKDKVHDLAILKIDDAAFTSFGSLPYAFKSSTAELGEKVYTLGFPREDMVYGEGSLSSRSGFEGDTTAYQISIPVNPGNSGGPLIDSQGNLIGVISGKQMEQEGAAFAIKSAYLKKLIEGMDTDTLSEPLTLSRRNNLAGLARTQQIKKLEDYVFMVKIYN